ncbi:Uncharacterized protein Adt_41780 [Abeliophyllum distichum]|uniref:Uncharacterized protein n=1 Tax=Abeliophyllum distichum TaxID=126358 RepID=A0ABD1PQM1_9LAMI
MEKKEINIMFLDVEMTEASEETSSFEELESFTADPNDLTRRLQVGKDLLEESKRALKRFLCHNLDVFTWKHEDMVGIDLKISCHHLNVDPEFPSHRRALRIAFHCLRVDATSGHELLSFMDAYSDYNQIFMYPLDEEHTSFVTDKGLYWYKVIPFGLKNIRATY